VTGIRSRESIILVSKLHINYLNLLKMKLQKSIIGIGVLLLSLSSCDDFLDRMPDDKKNEVDVFTRYEQVDNLVTDLYARAKFANRPLIFMNHFGSAGLTDECTASSHEQAIPHQFNIGNYGPSQGMPNNSSCGQYWWDLYNGIRRANIILEG